MVEDISNTTKNISNGILLRVLDLKKDSKSMSKKEEKSSETNGTKKTKDDRNNKNPQYITMFMAELLGTGLLMFLGCMGCVSEVDDPPAVHHMSALSFGLIVMLIIQAFGHISGAHLNPGVTLTAILYDIITPSMGVVYVLAQFIGAILGFGLLKFLIPEDYTKPGFCMTLPHPAVTSLQAFGIEIIITAVLMIVVSAVWDKRNADKPDSVPLRFGFIIVAISMVAGPFSGASMNTARTFAPAVLEGNFKDQWVYWIGPNVGAVIGVGIYKFLFALKEEKEVDEEEIHPLEDVTHTNQEKS